MIQMFLRGVRRSLALRDLTALLAVPQGFTLSVSGTLAACIGQRGTAALLDVWLFAIGAAVGFCSLALLTARAPRSAPNGTIDMSRVAVLNALPVVVIPAAVGATVWIASTAVAFLVAGALTAGLYVALLACVVARVRRPPRPTGA
jgi:hypothetical protein